MTTIATAAAMATSTTATTSLATVVVVVIVEGVVVGGAIRQWLSKWRRNYLLRCTPSGQKGSLCGTLGVGVPGGLCSEDEFTSFNEDQELGK
jgi:hypothetical protein